jgi:hypothetical protein
MGRPTKRTDAMREAALAALRQGRGYGGAAKAIGLARSVFIDWRREDPAFGQQCEDARETMVDVIEYELVQDALTPGNTLAKLGYLRAHRPHLYRVRMLTEEQTTVATPNAMVQQSRTVIVDGEPAPVPVLNNIMFCLPPNRRDQPEVFDHVEAIEEAPQPETIEAEPADAENVA